MVPWPRVSYGFSCFNRIRANLDGFLLILDPRFLNNRCLNVRLDSIARHRAHVIDRARCQGNCGYGQGLG